MTLNRLLLILSLAVLLAGGFLAYTYLYVPKQKIQQQLQAGLEAFNKTKYEEAYHHWIPLARAGNGKAQGNIAAVYLSGNGRAQNFFLAYVWIRLAEFNGDTSGEDILRLAKGRLTSDELTEAEAYIQKCIATHYKECD